MFCFRKSIWLFPALLLSVVEGRLPDHDPSQFLAAYYNSEGTITNQPASKQQHASSQPAAFSYRPAIESTGFYIGGEFLYWRLDECSMDYAYKNNSPPAVFVGNDRQSIVGELIMVDSHWDPGVRGNIGYRFPNWFWEVEGEYTFYYTSDSQTTRIGNGVNAHLVGTFPEFFLGAMESTSSNFYFHYHLARLHVARRFFVGDTIFLRIFAGPQAAWIDQKWKFKYVGQDQNVSRHKSNWEYEGGGIHVGMNSDWYLGAGFSVMFNGALAALYGSHRVLSFFDFSQNTGGVMQRFQPKTHRVAQMVQLSAGVAWGIVSKWVAFKFFASYELNTWFNLQEQYRVDLTGNTPDTLNEKVRSLTSCPLNLQGLTAGFLLEF